MSSKKRGRITNREPFLPLGSEAVSAKKRSKILKEALLQQKEIQHEDDNENNVAERNHDSAFVHHLKDNEYVEEDVDDFTGFSEAEQSLYAQWNFEDGINEEDETQVSSGVQPMPKLDNSIELFKGPNNVYKDPDDGRQRFLLELEFVQCLANPTYIHYLAQNRYFEDEAFIGYLKYLQYWQRPEYIKFIMYPHCLFFLELLQNPNFGNAMAHPANKELAHRQQFYIWKNYRKNRLKHILPKPLPSAPSASAGPPTTITTVPPVPSPAAAAQAPSPPLQYGMGPGSTSVKNDPRNSGVADRRKRKSRVGKNNNAGTASIR